MPVSCATSVSEPGRMGKVTATLRRAAIAVAALGLAGCGSIQSGDVFYVAKTYSYSLLVRETTNRNVPVRVLEQPFPGVPKTEIENAIIAAMPNGFLNRARYVVDPGGIASRGAKVFWHFDPHGLFPD